jgi:murein DD-endopeptidase MepM/ murein hydrolase activator NlpD
LLPVLALALGFLLTGGAIARAGDVQTPPASPQTTALLVASTNAPLRVLGSDGLQHLEYDLIFTNVFTAPVTLASIEVTGPDGSELLRLDGDALAASTTSVFGGEPSAVVPVGGTAATIIDLAVAADRVPAQVTHRISYNLPADAPALSLLGSRTLTGPALTVDPRDPLVIAPPLRGDGWLPANSCCDADSIHRALRLAVDGSHLVKPETFAIDWIQLQGERLFTGDGSQNEQYFGFGADVLSATAGTVVSVRDDMPEETPKQPPLNVLQPTDYAGNNVVVQVAPAVWATYAHLQPGSIRVAVGDRVAAGQPLALLGNSGNSTAPHLHFQLSDGPDVVTSNSLPFVFDHYTLAGAIDPQAAVAALVPPPAGEDGVMIEGAPAIPLEGAPEAQAGTYPLWPGVADFP